MPTGAVLLIKVPSSFAFASLGHLRERLVSECEIDLEDFRSGGPLEIVRSESGGPYPFKDDRVIWINSNLWNAYFDEEYPRGNIERIVMVADWCDQNIPECEIWYGHDIDDDNLKPFPPTRRQDLVKFSHELRGRS